MGGNAQLELIEIKPLPPLAAVPSTGLLPEQGRRSLAAYTILRLRG